MTDIVETIAEYLSMGGLFNPEMMEHDTVRNLIIECRAEITRLRADRDAGAKDYCALMERHDRLHVENERLREALKHIAAIYHVRIDDVRGNLWEHQRIALAALKEADK